MPTHRQIIAAWIAEEKLPRQGGRLFQERGTLYRTVSKAGGREPVARWLSLSGARVALFSDDETVGDLVDLAVSLLPLTEKYLVVHDVMSSDCRQLVREIQEQRHAACVRAATLLPRKAHRDEVRRLDDLLGLEWKPAAAAHRRQLPGKVTDVDRTPDRE